MRFARTQGILCQGRGLAANSAVCYCLGRQHEIGSIEVGKQADLAVWRLDELGQAGIVDPLAALVFGPLPKLELLLVGGRVVVEHGRLSTVDDDAVATELASASRRMQQYRADR